MTRVILAQPWNMSDENVKRHDLYHEWRNGPYSLLLLATILKRHGHEVRVLDLGRELVRVEGKREACLDRLNTLIMSFKPDIIGLGFFSFHKQTVKYILESAKRFSKTIGINPLFISGGIHATIEPQETLGLGFDYVFKGIADKGIVELANGVKPESINGIAECTLGEETENLDTLPFPDWSFCDYKFYMHPSYSRMRIRETSSLDLVTGRGCVWHCNFCAYNALAKVRFYSARYLLEQMRYMKSQFGANGIYFADSSIGNNRRLLRELCESVIKANLNMEWYANIRVDQVNEELLKLMWRAGCRLLLYGFESGSQRVLDLMNKKVDVADNYRVSELHNKLGFPYNASIIIGYPGETDKDVRETINFLRKARPTAVGINRYKLLPGSPDYAAGKKPSKIALSLIWQAMWEGNMAHLSISDKLKFGMRVVTRGAR